jgi:hypothetical protein
MKLSNLLKFWYVLICGFVLLTGWSVINRESELDTNTLKQASLKSDSPVSLQTYYLIEKYSTLYEVPKHIAYNVAYLETRYKGPFDWNYNPFLTSSAGAVGAMQVMEKTAEYITKKNIRKSTLKNNLELNISTSLKLLQVLHKKYKDWSIACGCYNTGYPKVNDYATFCISNRNYTKNWEFYE